MNGTLVRATALALLSMLLAGCGGGDGDATPTFSSTPTPTAQTTSVSPATSSSSPATEETPEAFIARWNRANTQMQNTGDTTEYRSLSRGCSACKTTADLIDQYYAAGGYVRTTAWKISGLNCSTANDVRVECTARVTYGRTQIVKESSAAEQSLDAGAFTGFFVLNLTDPQSWNLSNLQQQPS